MPDYDIKFARAFRDGDTTGRPVFIPGEAPGAIPNGSRVVKVWAEKADDHQVGAKATILSSMGPMDAALAAAAGRGDLDGEYAYFVEWDDLPGIPVFTRGKKLQRL